MQDTANASVSQAAAAVAYVADAKTCCPRRTNVERFHASTTVCDTVRRTKQHFQDARILFLSSEALPYTSARVA
jgi:hypothetical protein